MTEGSIWHQQREINLRLRHLLRDRGRKLGVMGTPNFFVAGKLVKKELTMEDIRAMVDPLLAGPATASAGAPN